MTFQNAAVLGRNGQQGLARSAERGADLGQVREHRGEVVDGRAGARRPRGRVLVAQRRAAQAPRCAASLTSSASPAGARAAHARARSCLSLGHPVIHHVNTQCAHHTTPCALKRLARSQGEAAQTIQPLRALAGCRLVQDLATAGRAVASPGHPSRARPRPSSSLPAPRVRSGGAQRASVAPPGPSPAASRPANASGGARSGARILARLCSRPLRNWCRPAAAPASASSNRATAAMRASSCRRSAAAAPVPPGAAAASWAGGSRLSG